MKKCLTSNDKVLKKINKNLSSVALYHELYFRSIKIVPKTDTNYRKTESMNYKLFETQTYRIIRRLMSTNKNLLEIKHSNKYGGLQETIFNLAHKHIKVSEKLIKSFKYRILLLLLLHTYINGD